MNITENWVLKLPELTLEADLSGGVAGDSPSQTQEGSIRNLARQRRQVQECHSVHVHKTWAFAIGMGPAIGRAFGREKDMCEEMQCVSMLSGVLLDWESCSSFWRDAVLLLLSPEIPEEGAFSTFLVNWNLRQYVGAGSLILQAPSIEMHLAR